MTVALLFLILVAVLFPGFLRVLLFALFIGGLMVLGAHAAGKCNLDALEVRASWSRSAQVCNMDWLDRKAMLITDVMAVDCLSLPKREYDKHIKDGVTRFNNIAAEEGWKSACAMADRQMTGVEKGM